MCWRDGWLAQRAHTWRPVIIPQAGEKENGFPWMALCPTGWAVWHNLCSCVFTMLYLSQKKKKKKKCPSLLNNIINTSWNLVNYVMGFFGFSLTNTALWGREMSSRHEPPLLKKSLNPHCAEKQGQILPHVVPLGWVSQLLKWFLWQISSLDGRETEAPVQNLGRERWRGEGMRGGGWKSGTLPWKVDLNQRWNSPCWFGREIHLPGPECHLLPQMPRLPAA